MALEGECIRFPKHLVESEFHGERRSSRSTESCESFEKEVWDVDKVEMCRDRDVLPKCKACAADLKRKDAPEVCTDFAYQGVKDFNT